MTTVQLTAAVKGRLPYGWRIIASYDSSTSIINITSPDTDQFSINISMYDLDKYTATHTSTPGVLMDASIEAKYVKESGVIRYDSPDLPEFWLEVSLIGILVLISHAIEQVLT